MKTPDQIIDEALGIIDPVKTAISENKITVPRPPQDLDDTDADYKYQRENFYNLVERGQDAIDGILQIAKESDHPRTYEVAGNLIKQVAEVTEKLGDLHLKMQKLSAYQNYFFLHIFAKLKTIQSLNLQKKYLVQLLTHTASLQKNFLFY